MSALDRLERYCATTVKGLDYRNAASYYTLLINNILNADAKYGFHGKAPYSHRYAAWKKTWGKFWQLHGDLLSSIEKKRSKGGWSVGIPKGKMDSGGKSWFGKTVAHPAPRGKSREIAMYAYFLEHGRKGQPPRPIVGPTREEYAQGDWIKHGTKALRGLRGAWR